MNTSYCLFSKEFFQNIKNNLAAFPCSPSQVEQVQWNLYGKIICLCNYNYNIYERGFAKVKHKREIASSFRFLLGHLKYDSVFKNSQLKILGLNHLEVLTNGKEMAIKHW